MAYGPGQPSWKLIPSVAGALVRGESPQVNSPERSIDWIYVSDLIDGLLLIGEADGVEGQTLDLGSGELVTIREVVELLQKLAKTAAQPKFAAASAREGERVVKADLAATAQRLGWMPKTALRDGLVLTLESLRQCKGAQ